MPHQLADAHVHVDLYLEREALLDRAAAAKVVPFIVTTRPSEYRNVSRLFGGRGDAVRIGLGFHPEAAASAYSELELSILERYFAETRWIGEIGLDGPIGESAGQYFGNAPTLTEQTKAFERILGLGVRDKILSVHSRGVEPQAIDMLRAAGARAVMLHWFRGDRATAARAVELGYLFSLNVGMLADPALREIMAWLPAENVLLETDGPFTDINGVPCEPKDVRAFLPMLAELRGEDADGLEAQINANFARLDAAGLMPCSP